MIVIGIYLIDNVRCEETGDGRLIISQRELVISLRIISTKAYASRPLPDPVPHLSIIPIGNFEKSRP